MKDRAQIVHENFLRRVATQDFPDTHIITHTDAGLSPQQCVEIFESQVLSRRLDMEARALQAKGEGFYTIGSSGHEGMAAVAAALRLKDMAFLHYRDAAFMIQRSKTLPGQTPLWDILLSFVASSEDPISAGRHKVLGSKALYIPPQTSTIASHLPKAVGAAYSIGLNKRIETEGVLPDDSIIICSFGDASVNHSTAQGAFNTAEWASYQGAALPLLFVCEDNGIGISTPTPQNWIQKTFENRPALKYFECNGLNIFETYKTTCKAAQYVRTRKAPVFLHKKCVRLFGHAGADIQTVYMGKDIIEQTEAEDPLLHTANLLIQNGILTSDQVLDIYNETGLRVEKAAKEVIKRPKLETVAQVKQSIIPPFKTVAQIQHKTGKFDTQPRHMAQLINRALHDLMLSHDNIVLAGQDIGPKGGVYNVTNGLYDAFGAHRVINTPLDEQSILGLAIGMAHNGTIPIPEIQFLAYLHNAEDQIRGEAATLPFFSNGQFTNPMVIRVAGLAYQKGFGGHFHNDNAISVLRDVPGLIIACPSNGADAIEMLRESVRLAREEQRVIIFLEPIALYMTRDLHEENDGLWSFPYQPETWQSRGNDKRGIRLGDLHIEGDGTDLCILTYGNGYYRSRQAAKMLEEEHNIDIRVVDLRWLAPPNETAIMEAVQSCEHILIVDECRRSGSLSETLMTMILENLNPLPKIKRLTADDCFIPLGPASDITLPGKETIIDTALTLLGKESS